MMTMGYRSIATYRCPKGCWWESNGCYCNDLHSRGVHRLNGLAGLNGWGSVSPATLTLAGLVLAGLAWWHWR